MTKKITLSWTAMWKLPIQNPFYSFCVKLPKRSPPNVIVASPIVGNFSETYVSTELGQQFRKVVTLCFWLAPGNSTNLFVSESPKVLSALFDLLQLWGYVSSSLLLIALHFD